MAEGQRCDRQARHDLVADAEIDRRVEHVVRQADRGRHGDHVAREQRQFHAGLALGDAVAHRRHAARHLRDAAGFARRLLDQLRKGLEGLMRRQHVVVGGDDAEVGYPVAAERDLFRRAADGEAVGEIAAGKHRAVGGAARRLGDAVEIGLAPRLRALADAVGDGFDVFSCRHRTGPFNMPRKSGRLFQTGHAQTRAYSAQNISTGLAA